MINQIEDDLSSYSSLNKEFENVLQELANDKSLERFRIEYEKLYKALMTSHENQRKLCKQCQELNENILNNSAQVKQQTEEISETIGNLKQEIEKIQKLVELSNNRQDKNTLKIESLSAEVKHLAQIVQQSDIKH